MSRVVLSRTLKFKFKFFYQKKSSLRTYHLLQLPTRFCFGEIAFLTTSFMIFNLKRSLRFVLFIKRIIRRRFRGIRRFWILPGDYFRVSYKSKGARMGKGKGKSANILRRISPLSNLVEFKNVRPGRIFFFKRVINSRLPRPVVVLSKFNFFVYPGLTVWK